MIEQNELRIGNYVEYPSIGIKKIESGHDIDMIVSNNAMPVEITEDILLQCGFKHFDNKESHFTPLYSKYEDMFELTFTEKYDHVFLSIYNMRTTTEQMVPDGGIRPLPVKYLHQLQNLYYIISGKELEVQL